MVWQVKRLRVWLKDENGLPGARIICWWRATHWIWKKSKYFLSNAPENTPVETLLVAFSRWKIERIFEDGKGELGLDHFEVRKYLSIQRHLILSCVSYLFLAEFHLEHRGEKSGTDALPGAHGHGETGADLASWRTMFEGFGGVDPAAVTDHAGTFREGTRQPPQANASPVARYRDVPEGSTHLQLASFVAL